MSEDVPWFRPEQGDEWLSDEEWQAVVGHLPCTCDDGGSAMCFQHTASRLSIKVPAEWLDDDDV